MSKSPARFATRDAILNSIRNDEEDGGLHYRDFVQLFRVFQAVLEKMSWFVRDDEGWGTPPGMALANLAFYMDDEQRAFLNKITTAADRIDEAAAKQLITDELFTAQREPRYAEGNPELFDFAFWKYMVRSRISAYRARTYFDPTGREYFKRLEEKGDPLKWLEGSQEELEAWWATVPRYHTGNAVWSFQRYANTCTSLADGREIWIGGTHENFYDYDFQIYNDVIVIHPNLEIDIYGYSLNDFKPTDYHSATLVGDGIYIIGRLGYHGTRQPGLTPVHRLDCQSFQMETIATWGENPGWINSHHAEYLPEYNAIKVTNGDIFLRFEGKRTIRKNRATYWLDLTTGEWTRGNGKQFKNKRRNTAGQGSVLGVVDGTHETSEDSAH